MFSRLSNLKYMNVSSSSSVDVCDLLDFIWMKRCVLKEDLFVFCNVDKSTLQKKIHNYIFFFFEIIRK